MAVAGGPPEPFRRNVLTLDGGGVRGLSSLLILQDLMRRINTSIRDGRPPGEIHNDVHPHDVFDFVAGTSTGGLIALMLGKLGMSLEDCIERYHELSTTIFGTMHIRGKITHGLAPCRYSGRRLRECVRDLLHSRGFNRNLPMISEESSDVIACAVVCREHESESKYSGFKPGAVCICSLPCQNSFTCHMCDAARATSAAPTFFPVVNIAGQCFVDGGMEYNNPTHAIHYHYTEYDRVVGSRRTSMVDIAAAPITRHGNLNFSRVRMVNLGTGTRTEALPPRRRDILADFVPSFIRMGVFLKKTLTEIAVNSENVARQMESIAQVSKGDVKYYRFSADNGVCYIKLDSYKDLKQIETLTQKYLEKAATQKNLEKVANEIARDFLQKHDAQLDAVSSNNRLIVPESNRPTTPRHPPCAPNTSKPNPDTPSTTGSSTDPSESSLRQGPSRDTSTNSTELEIMSASVGGLLKDAEIEPAIVHTGIVSRNTAPDITRPAEPIIDPQATTIESPVVPA